MNKNALVSQKYRGILLNPRRALKLIFTGINDILIFFNDIQVNVIVSS